MKNLIIFGIKTREAKRVPLVRAFQKSNTFETKVCVTAQHREMLDQVLDFFDIQPDFDFSRYEALVKIYMVLQHQ